MQVWRIPLWPPPEDLERRYASLPPEERERADRYMFEKDRVQLIVSHHATRLLLSRYLDGPAPTLKRAAHGKPFIEGSRLRFNLSHARGLALAAFAWDAELGVDVEDTTRSVEHLQLAQRFFSEPEARELERQPPDRVSDTFFVVWTRKEAYIKALGDGLSHPLDRFQVSLQAERPQFLNCPGWELHRIPVPQGYEAALAVEGEGFQVRVKDFPATGDL